MSALSRLYVRVLLLGLLSTTADDALAAENADASLEVAIAVPAGDFSSRSAKSARVIDLARDEDHFHVVLTNRSKVPQRLWETWNSWGYDNLSFEVVDEQGKVIATIRKKPTDFNRNFPSCIVLEPGEHFVLDVGFDPSEWDIASLWTSSGLIGVHFLRIRAVYEIFPDPDSRTHGVWTGRAVSAASDYELRYWRRSPPSIDDSPNSSVVAIVYLLATVLMAAVAAYVIFLFRRRRLPTS